MDFDKCLSGSNMSIEFVQGTELTQILFTWESSGNTSIIQEALDELRYLVDNLKRLQALPKMCMKNTLIQFCGKENFLFNVLQDRGSSSSVSVVCVAKSTCYYSSGHKVVQ